MLKRKEINKSNKKPKNYTKEEIDTILKETRFIDCGNGYSIIKKQIRKLINQLLFLLKSF